eukprot:4021001-Pleurochrysis_carterae.AAC.1
MRARPPSPSRSRRSVSPPLLQALPANFGGVEAGRRRHLLRQRPRVLRCPRRHPVLRREERGVAPLAVGALARRHRVHALVPDRRPHAARRTCIRARRRPAALPSVGAHPASASACLVPARP